MSVTAVLLAGGTGERFGSHVPKPFISLNGKPVIQWALDVIEPLVDEVIIVSRTPYRHYRHVMAGATRSDSAEAGVRAATPGNTILIHDAVRPFITTDHVKKVLAAAQRHLVVDTVVPVTDGIVAYGRPEEKRDFRLGQTPEVFEWHTLIGAFSARDPGTSYQDEVTMVYELRGMVPYCIEGPAVNMKLTTAQDLASAEGALRYWDVAPSLSPSEHVRSRRTLLFGGSGTVGTELRSRLRNVIWPPHASYHIGGPLTFIHRRFDAFDALVHAAATYGEDGTEMDVNFMSAVRMVERARVTGWRGNVVVFGSTAATYGRRGAALYSASKAALTSWVEASHEDLAEAGIYLNCIAPAKIQGRLQATLNPDADQSQMLTAAYVADRTLPYLDTQRHGDIVYLRYGLEGH